MAYIVMACIVMAFSSGQRSALGACYRACARPPGARPARAGFALSAGRREAARCQGTAACYMVMAYIGMACMVMAYLVMALCWPTRGGKMPRHCCLLHGYGLHSYGHGLYRYGSYSYGSAGRRDAARCFGHNYMVLACIVMACIGMAYIPV